MNEQLVTLKMRSDVANLFIKWYEKYFRKSRKLMAKKNTKPYRNPHFLKELALKSKREEILNLKRIESKNNREQQIAYYMRVLQMRGQSLS